MREKKAKAPAVAPSKPTPAVTKPAPAAAKKPVAEKKDAAKKPKGKPGSKKDTTAAASPAPNALPSVAALQETEAKRKDAARKILTFMQRVHARKLEQKRVEYEKQVREMEKKAYAEQVAFERRMLEKERQREEELVRARKEKIKREHDLMEGAFDGQTDLLKKLLEEGKIFYDFCDKSGNTPISEAAAGGQCDCIRLLYDYGADINRQCQFKRTPLYRAIFGGHIDAVRLILDLGGDPRIPDEEGQACLKMPCLPEIGKIVQEWDLSKTDALLQKLEGVKQLKQKELIEKRATQMSQLNQALEDAQKAHAMAQQELSYVYCQLNIRINEHDLLMSEGKDLSIIKTAIHEYEDKLDHARAAAKKAGDALSACKEKIELQQQTDAEQTGAPPGQAAPEKGIKCNIKQLEGLLLKPDPRGEVLKSNGQWPLVVDPSGRSAVFLRYADSNILQVLNPQHMDAEKIRIAVIGSIRYGKPLVIDICEVDVSKSIPEYFNRVEKDLYASIVSRSILQNEKYLSLCRKGDGDQYKRECFHQRYVENFKFIILTTNRFPSEDLVQAFFPVRVVC